jgi:hypothetical protein
MAALCGGAADRHFKDDMLYSAVREYKYLRREYQGATSHRGAACDQRNLELLETIRRASALEG